MPGTETTQNYDEIFTDDKLNIKSYVVDFAHLIEQDTYKEGTSSKVYTISAEFGSGKTFFCDKLKEVLSKDQVKVGKLNIWEMDFYENPLIPVLAELNRLYTKGKRLPSKIVETVGKISSNTFSALCEVTAKAALGQDTVEVCKKKFSPQTIYNDYNEYHKALLNLKETLSKWSSKQEKPIVIIIDELDRCKPDYAVKTLEVLKHFFDVPGFVFVLAIDEEQLKNSVQTLFGTIDYEGYKRKFINNSFLLPEPDKLAFSNFLYDKSGINDIIKQIQQEKRELVFTINIYNTFFCAYDYSLYGDESERILSQQFNEKQTSKDIITKYFAAYSKCFEFSLRKMEQVFDRLVLFTKQINAGKELFSPDLAIFLICVHEVGAKAFNEIRYAENHNSSMLQLALSCDFASNMNSHQKSFIKTHAPIDRNIIPEVLPIVRYSYIVDQSTEEPKRVIFDNVDRFFATDPELWIYESGAIDTKGVLKPRCGFDAQKFRENYCKHIEFISHFE